MGRFKLKVKEDFATIRVVPLWIQLPREVGHSLSLEARIQKLTFTWCGGREGGSVSEGIQAVTSMGPSSSGRFCDSLISP